MAIGPLINNGIVCQMKRAYADRKARTLPKSNLLASCKRVKHALIPSTTMVDFFRNAAGAYFEERGTSAMFVYYSEYCENLILMSSSGLFAEYNPSFPLDNQIRIVQKDLLDKLRVRDPEVEVPEIETLITMSFGAPFSFELNPLMQSALFDKVSIHIPEIGLQRGVNVQFLDNEKVVEVKEYGDPPNTFLPTGFQREQGAVLTTPLSIENSIDLEFGFIYEYQESGHFPFSVIQDARTYSALFSWQLAKKMLAEKDCMLLDSVAQQTKKVI